MAKYDQQLKEKAMKLDGIEMNRPMDGMGANANIG